VTLVIETEKPGAVIVKVPDDDLSRRIDQAIWETSTVDGAQQTIELLIDGQRQSRG
jgi:flagellar basal body rod protein FlgG